MPSDDVSFVDAIARGLEARLAKVWTALPGKVVNFYSETQTIDVQPQIQNAFLDVDGKEVIERLPQMKDVPIIYLRSVGKNFAITCPLEAGDTVLLIVNSRAISRWRYSDKEVVPENNRLHDLSDAVAIPGLFSEKKLSSIPADTMVIGKTDSGPSIHINNTEIKLGAPDASDYVALASLVLNRLNVIKGIVQGLGGVFPQGFPGSVAATKVKAK